MDREKVYEAVALRSATWRRDFWRDKAQVARTHEELTRGFSDQLKSAARDYDNLLHPNHAIQLERDKLAVSLIDNGSPLLICFVNTANPGYLVLQFMNRKGDETKQQLTLECTDKAQFVWIVPGSHQLPAHEMPSYILRELIKLATLEINRETEMRSD